MVDPADNFGEGKCILQLFYAEKIVSQSNINEIIRKIIEAYKRAFVSYDSRPTLVNEDLERGLALFGRKAKFSSNCVEKRACPRMSAYPGK